VLYTFRTGLAHIGPCQGKLETTTIGSLASVYEPETWVYWLTAPNKPRKIWGNMIVTMFHHGDGDEHPGAVVHRNIKSYVTVQLQPDTCSGSAHIFWNFV